MKERVGALGRLLVFLATCIPVCGKGVAPEEAIVASVNGEPVTVKEFKQRLNTTVAEVYAYFYRSHHVSDNPDFWTTNYGGEVPIVLARRLTLRDIKHRKVLLIAAQKHGLIKDISYGHFLDTLERVNQMRRTSAANHGVVFGPVQYTEDDFFSMMLNNLETELKHELAREKSGITDTYYENSRYGRYIESLEHGARVTVDRVVLSKIFIR